MIDETLRAPTPEDPVAGRSLDMWMRAYRSRAERLNRLVDLKAPPNIISNEIRLVTQALSALELLVGDASQQGAVQ